MPLYEFRNKETGKVFNEFFGYAAKLIFLKENPHLESVIGAPAVVSDRVIHTAAMVNSDHKSRLKQIAKDYPGCNINTL